MDSVKVSAEMKAYQPIPVIVEFKNEDGSDNLKETIEANYRKVKQEILTLVDSEIQRIKTPLPCPISFQTSSANTDWVLWLRCYD